MSVSISLSVRRVLSALLIEGRGTQEYSSFALTGTEGQRSKKESERVRMNIMRIELILSNVPLGSGVGPGN